MNIDYKNIREQIKLKIWDYIDIVNKVLQIFFIFVSVISIGVVLYYYGFPQTAATLKFCDNIVVGSLFFYILKYVLQCFFNRHSLDFLRKHWKQGIIIVLLIFWFILFYFIGSGGLFTGSGKIGNIIIFSIQAYFFILMLLESSIGNIINKIKIGPSGLMIVSFLFLILVGTSLLLMPEMTVSKINFLDAFFTSTSVCCVTGLSIIDIKTTFSFKGQLIIMFLAQFGGINILCFTSFLAYFYRGTKLRYQSVVKEMLNTTLQGSRKLIREIIIFTFIIEGIGFIFILIYLIVTQQNNGIFNNIFLSAFHTISAFSNTGICLLKDELPSYVLQHNYYILVVMTIMSFLGGIGFFTIHDIFTNKQKTKNRWANLQVSTKIVLQLSGIIILFGMLSFFILEYNNVIASYSLKDKIFTSFFYAVTSRVAGFNTVDFSLLNMSTRLIFIVLMIIGTASGSTGGGIKLTTFYILFKSAIATISGKKQVTVFNKAISYDIVDKAYLVLLFSLSVIFISTFALSISDPQFSLEKIIFEVSTAFSTVGLSIGVVANLSDFGKYVIIFVMYIGRITVLTLALSITRRAFNRYSLATTNTGFLGNI